MAKVTSKRSIVFYVGLVPLYNAFLIVPLLPSSMKAYEMDKHKNHDVEKQKEF